MNKTLAAFVLSCMTLTVSAHGETIEDITRKTAFHLYSHTVDGYLSLAHLALNEHARAKNEYESARNEYLRLQGRYHARVKRELPSSVEPLIRAGNHLISVLDKELEVHDSILDNDRDRHCALHSAQLLAKDHRERSPYDKDCLENDRLPRLTRNYAGFTKDYRKAADLLRPYVDGVEDIRKGEAKISQWRELQRKENQAHIANLKHQLQEARDNAGKAQPEDYAIESLPAFD